MADRLASARLKRDRAREHLKALKEQCWLFMNQEPKPYGISDKLKQEGQWSVALLDVRQHPPIEFGLIAGDFINNINAALDHLVYGLSATKKKGTGFPISVDPDSYVFTSRKKKVSDRDRLLAGVIEDERALIDAYQPYANGMEADPLWRMREFANTDKHRVTHPAFARMHRYRVIAPGCEIAMELCEHAGPFDNGTPLFRFSVSCGGPYGRNVKVRTEVVLSIGFGPLLVDLVEFDEMLGLTSEIIDAF